MKSIERILRFPKVSATEDSWRRSTASTKVSLNRLVEFFFFSTTKFYPNWKNRKCSSLIFVNVCFVKAKNVVPHAEEDLPYMNCGTFSANFADPSAFVCAVQHCSHERMAIADLPYRMCLTQWAGGKINILRMGSPGTLKCSGRALVCFFQILIVVILTLMGNILIVTCNTFPLRDSFLFKKKKFEWINWLESTFEIDVSEKYFLTRDGKNRRICARLSDVRDFLKRINYLHKYKN